MSNQSKLPPMSEWSDKDLAIYIKCLYRLSPLLSNKHLLLLKAGTDLLIEDESRGSAFDRDPLLYQRISKLFFLYQETIDESWDAETYHE